MADCPGPCQELIPDHQISCSDCLILLPEDLVVLASQARNIPELYATVLRCVGLWFQVKHQVKPLETTQLARPASLSA